MPGLGANECGLRKGPEFRVLCSPFMNIQFVTSTDGDWEGMYIDGKLVAEGHSVSPYEIFAQLLKHIPGLTYSSQEKNEEWFEKHGYKCATVLEEVDHAE